MGMRVTGINILRISILPVLSALTMTAAIGDEPESAPVLEADAIGWQRIEYFARKFIFGASSAVEWSLLDESNARVDWIDPEGLPGVEGELIAPPERVLRMKYTSDLLGRHFDTVYWMDPGTGAALQYETSDDGGRPRHRVYRFTTRGAFQRTWRPLKQEKQLPWEDWTDRSGDFRPFQPEAHQRVVIDPVGLTYIVAASRLGRGADRLDVLAFVGRHVSRAVLTTGDPVEIDFNFSAQTSSGELHCKGRIMALTVKLGVEAVGDVIDDSFDFVGLQRDIEIFLIPDSRLPVRMTGRAKIAGRLAINARHVRMLDDRGCPA